jgi:hypothetical protein
MVLEKKDFESYNWQQVIFGCDKKERFKYCGLFCQMAAEAQASGDEKGQEVFSLLGAATGFTLKPDSKKEPFPSGWLERFTPEHLSLFKELAPGVIDAEMRARLADIVWARQRDPEMGRLAADSYLESARILEDPEHWSPCAHRIARAVHIGRSLGKESDQFSRGIAHVQSVLDKYDGDDPLLLSAVMMELLQEYRQGESTKYIILSQKSAHRALAAMQWNIARRYLHIKAKWHFLANETEAASLVRQEVAETYVKEAEKIINRPMQAAPYSHACHKIEQAIKAYKDLGGPSARSRWEELYKVLREYQQRANSELLPINIPFDSTITAIAATYTEFGINQVKGKPLTDALQILAYLPLIQSVARLREQIDNFVRSSPASLLLPIVVHGGSGQVISRPPAHPKSKEEQIEAEVKTNLFLHSNSERRFRTQYMLLPATQQINAEHSIGLQDVMQFVIDNPFVPAGREFLYAKGLHAGLTGDHLVAAHLLIPQIENSIRHILSQHGVITSAFSRQDIQNHYDLNTMLNDKRIKQKLKEILGEDLFFELKGLLVHHAGANLRNEIAHGTLSVDEFNGDFYGLQSIYLWWLAWRLCFTPVAPRNEPSKTTNAGRNEDAT